MATDSSPKLTLFETCGTAIGGMVGGGIFAVLGEAVVTAGYATFISLGLAGLLALVTGIVYSKLTVEYDESGGCFTFIEHILGLQVAGITSWVLLTGYMCTIGLYAYAFGSYADRLIGYGIGPNPWLASCIITAIVTLLLLQNYKTTRESTDFFIYLKICIIGGIIVIGFFTMKRSRMTPFHGFAHENILLAAALIFVIYEGFQILTYRYDIIQDHKKNLPKAIWISIAIVAAAYMIIAFLLTSSLGPAVIARNEETAIALLAQPVAGKVGIDMVLIGGLISTSAAIYTTTHATGQLAEIIVDDGQLPYQMTQKVWKRTPVVFTILFGAGAIALQYILQLDALTTLCSALFLMVFCIVNYMGFIHQVFKGWKRYLTLLGSAACAGGLVMLIAHSYYQSWEALLLMIGVITLLIIFRILFTTFHGGYKGTLHLNDEQD